MSYGSLTWTPDKSALLPRENLLDTLWTMTLGSPYDAIIVLWPMALVPQSTNPGVIYNLWTYGEGYPCIVVRPISPSMFDSGPCWLNNYVYMSSFSVNWHGFQWFSEYEVTIPPHPPASSGSLPFQVSSYQHLWAVCFIVNRDSSFDLSLNSR